MVADIEAFLPEDLKKRAKHVGNELMLSYEDALTAITIANEHHIAILGFDSGEMESGGFQVLAYSNYDRSVSLTNGWKEYFKAMNDLASEWLRNHRLSGGNCGYILTSTSEREFIQMNGLRETP